MVLPDLMESEEVLIDYVKLKNIEGKVLIKQACKHEDIEENKNENIEENSMPIEDNTEEKRPERDILDDVTSNLVQEPPVNDCEKCDEKTPEQNKATKNKKRGILKYERTYPNKHVDFNMDLEYVPFDETKDYTIEIQIVEQMPKKIVSYAALFAQQKKEEKLKKEAEEKEKQNRKHNKKRKYLEWKKILKQDKTPIQDIDVGNSQITENNAADNHSIVENEKDEEKDDYSYHSDSDKDEYSDYGSTGSESFISIEGNTSTNLSDEPKSECIAPIDDLSESLNDTQTEDEIKRNELLENHYLNSHLDEELSTTCETSAIPENIFHNSKSFSVPAKKQRSNSLSDLEGFKKIHRFLVKRLPKEIELIVCRELEKQYE